MNSKRQFWLSLWLLGLLLVGCQNETPLETLPAPTFDASVVVFPTVIAPTDGTSAITGFVTSLETGLPVPQVAVQLAEVYREDDTDEGIFVLDYAQSPYTETNDQGWFAFQGLPPGEYVLVVGLVESNDYYIVPEESGKPKVWTAVANSVTDVGHIVSDPIQYVIQRDTFSVVPGSNIEEEGYPAPTTNDAYPSPTP
jgi:hypothetical protein